MADFENKDRDDINRNEEDSHFDTEKQPEGSPTNEQPEEHPTDEQSENGARDRDVTVTADEGYDLFAPSPRIGFAGYGIALSWESLEAGEARTIEGCDRYLMQEASVEGGAYYHVS